ncbi:hypothetical protein J6590_079240 [Homalodisca vitripennis]|nr:hypothetical protein J6590_079240 [Homalodisca vitripennis]
MAGPVYHECYCGSWQDLCTGMATVGHGRTSVLDYCGSWQDLCTRMATVGHGRTSVPDYCGSWQDLCTYAVTQITKDLRSTSNLRYSESVHEILWEDVLQIPCDGERCMGRGTPTDPPLATDDSRPQSNQAVITNL